MSIWVKRIIQPNKEHKASPTSSSQLSHDFQKGSESQRTISSSISLRDPTTHKSKRSQNLALLNTNKATSAISKRNVKFPKEQDDSSAEKRNFHFVHRNRHSVNKPLLGKVEFEHPNDNASTAPLVSVCSSSMKSNTFSDVHSAQSTRATEFSNKTFDTNSSTIGIPPASIVDRGRYTVEALSVLSMTSSQITTNHPQGRGPNLRANSIYNSVSHKSSSTILEG